MKGKKKLVKVWRVTASSIIHHFDLMLSVNHATNITGGTGSFLTLLCVQRAKEIYRGVKEEGGKEQSLLNTHQRAVKL